MKQEEAKKNSRWTCIIWVIYICLIVFLGFMGFLRLIGLLRRVLWREDLEGEFPSMCGDWAKDHGCTRVTLESEGCVRTNEIVGNNSIIFETNLDSLLNSEISSCVNGLTGAKLVSPSDLHGSKKHG